VQGTASGVKSITDEDVKDFYKTHFAQDNLTIGIAGNYSSDFLDRMKKDMESLPATATPAPAPPVGRTPDGLDVEIISKDNALGSAIFMGFPLPITRKDNDFAALMVANSWLGEHRKSYSLLYRKIREERSMNYGDYSYIEWYQNGGSNMLPAFGVPRSSNYFSIWIRPVQTAKGLKGQYPELSKINIGHAHFAIRMALREMNNLITNGLTEEQFEQTRDFLRSYNKLYVQDMAHQLGFLMDSRFYGRKDYISEMDGLLAKLTLADVNNAMKKYWQTNNMFITIVTDKSEAEPLAASLRANKPSPMSYSNNLKASLDKKILEEDEIVAKYPLNVKSVKIVDTADMFK
jgi:zinc protease